ncbi:MAG: S46 family peptidase [Bacteroidia bacterium]
MRLLRTLLFASLLLLTSLIAIPANAGGGMWIPMLLEQLNEDEMQTMGLKLTAEDIYSVNNSSLKDAIVKFGRGCTGEIISEDGLLLTNHHCGYGTIQSHSSVDNDYLTDGFWAMNRSEELKNAGLTVTFIVRMEDVTSQVLAGVSDDMSEPARNQITAANIRAIGQEATNGTHYEAEIKPFYQGNEYYMFVLEIFKDVRLVGAPPSEIGNFGGDTDNWIWPRHTGDFSLFRVYSGPDGKPAEYSENNIPLKPRHSLPVSLKSKEEGDFTMVYGFPARTEQYLPSYAVEHELERNFPTRVDLRTEILDIMKDWMRGNDTIRIKYSSKAKGVSNGWKKWIGAIRGLKRTKAVQKKLDYEAEFTERINNNPKWKNAYGTILSDYKTAYEKLIPVHRREVYFFEAIWSVEAIRQARMVEPLLLALEGNEDMKTRIGSFEEEAKKRKGQLNGYFKNYDARVDMGVMGAMLTQFCANIARSEWPASLAEAYDKYDGDLQAFADNAREESFLVNRARFEAALDKAASKEKSKWLRKDPILNIGLDLLGWYRKDVSLDLSVVEAEIDALHREYMQAQREVFDDKRFFPDANFTLRLSYGKMEGYTPDNGVRYLPFTTVDGILEKASNENIEDYVISDKLEKLLKDRTYGRYAQDGKLWTCFVASNHTSGGNSGSPVIDAEGHLIGLNFDRGWDGTMSDINYDRRLCRNISVDIRYVLWVIEHYAGAGYLVDEMRLVE